MFAIYLLLYYKIVPYYHYYINCNYKIPVCYILFQICGLVNSVLYLISTIIALRTYRGLWVFYTQCFVPRIQTRFEIIHLTVVFHICIYFSRKSSTTFSMSSTVQLCATQRFFIQWLQKFDKRYFFYFIYFNYIYTVKRREIS